MMSMSAAATPVSSLGVASGVASASAMQSEQIAEELRRIRKAREEREAQRRMAALAV
jgi:hypothetical protein